MKNIVLSMFIISIVLASLQCRKEKRPQSPPEGDQLPPITQEGKMTIGFKLNGEVLLPKGYTGVSNPTVIYDPSFEGGSLSISMYHIDKKDPDSLRHYLIIGAKNLDKTGTYPVTTPMTNVGIQYTKYFQSTNTGCEYRFTEDGTKQSGSLTITRLDVSNRIVAGTFSFVLTKAGCDTISINEGRFDLKL